MFLLQSSRSLMKVGVEMSQVIWEDQTAQCQLSDAFQSPHVMEMSEAISDSTTLCTNPANQIAQRLVHYTNTRAD